MEIDPFKNTNQPEINSTLPPPTGLPLAESELGNLPIDPTIESLENKQDVGEINIDEIKSVYHGIRASIANKKMERAGSVLEKMDHKESLYSHLGAVSIGDQVEVDAVKLANRNTIHENPKPRTWAERLKDKRIDKKARKLRRKESERKFVESAFQGAKSNTTGVKSRFETAKKKNEINQSYKTGGITVAERNSKISQLKAIPVATENSGQKKSRKKLARADKGVRKAANQPFLSTWREFRRNRAIETIKTQHMKAEEHKEKAKKI
jgi:hypothetical protein